MALARSRPASSCTLAAPVPDLPAPLRILGGFDQAIDGGDPRQLQDLAQEAASAVEPTLGAAVPTSPVAVRALRGGDHDAVVVPLIGSAFSSGGTPRVEGLVAFLSDCGGRLYFSQVADLVRTLTGADLPATFPVVSAASAAATLHAGSVELVYDTSVFTPLWRDPTQGRTTTAG